MSHHAGSRPIVTWIAVSLSTLFASLAAYWGSIETFHEGWYYREWWMNVTLTFAQYLSPMLFLGISGAIAIRWPRAGAALHLVGAGASAMFFGRGGAVILTIPLTVAGVLYWFARPPRSAVWVLLSVPTAVALVSGAYPGYLAVTRADDEVTAPRTIEGNGVTLTWAPAGPGWPDNGVTWEQAGSTCAALSPDGRSVVSPPPQIWRLPTADEAVRSCVRHGRNAGGVWNPAARSASYTIPPNKESPLWNRYSKVIYWWTATELNDTRAYRLVWNGRVEPAPKKARWGYLAYRCVKS